MVQQYESCEQMSVAQVSQPVFSFVPVEQMACVQVLPPPPPPPPPVPVQDSPQTEATSPTQTESHELLQQ